MFLRNMLREYIEADDRIQFKLESVKRGEECRQVKKHNTIKPLQIINIDFSTKIG
jgi:hypothetical protein